MLKTQGHNTLLIVLGSNKIARSQQLVNSTMKKSEPDIVCFTAVASQYQFIKNMAAYIKNKWPHKLLIIGGTHATLNPDEVIKGDFNALCIGEGEYPLTELCNQLEHNGIIQSIPNIWIKRNGGTIEKNPTRPFLQNLDILPFPEREIWKPWMSKEAYKTQWSVLLGRGCVYNCSYCSNHALRKIAAGNYVRMRSPNNIIQEISSLHETFPESKKIFFEVEAICLDKEWTFGFCKQLQFYNSTINNYIAYACNFRISPQSIDEKLFAAMKSANIQTINIGLESGSERVRQEVLKRNYSNEDFLSVVSLARKFSIKINVFNMIGIPGETFNEYLKTVFLNRNAQPDDHYTGIFFPYPGTEIYNICIEQKFISKYISTKMERKQSVLNLPGFTKRQIQSAYTWFNYRVYRGHRSLLKLLIQLIIIKLRSRSSTNYLFHKLSRLLYPIRNRLALK